MHSWLAKVVDSIELCTHGDDWLQIFKKNHQDYNKNQSQKMILKVMKAFQKGVSKNSKLEMILQNFKNTEKEKDALKQRVIIILNKYKINPALSRYGSYTSRICCVSKTKK